MIAEYNTEKLFPKIETGGEGGSSKGTTTMIVLGVITIGLIYAYNKSMLDSFLPNNLKKTPVVIKE